MRDLIPGFPGRPSEIRITQETQYSSSINQMAMAAYQLDRRLRQLAAAGLLGFEQTYPDINGDMVWHLHWKGEQS